MRERLRWIVAAYDWLARIHFALFTLGGIGVVVGIVTYILEAPLPTLLFGGMGAVSLVLGSIGWVRSRRVGSAQEWRQIALRALDIGETLSGEPDKLTV